MRPALDELQEQLLVEVRQRFGAEAQPQDTLTSLGVDSVGMAEFTVELERHFDIRVDESILDVETVAELAEYIHEQIPDA